MKHRIVALASVLALALAACKDPDNPGNDSLLTGASVIGVIVSLRSSYG